MAVNRVKIRHILVTGACGFLGSEIVRQAMAAGITVSATDRIESPPRPVPGYRPADILHPSTLQPLMAGVDCVIHAAGLAHIFKKGQTKTAPFKAINEVGTANVVRVAVEAGVRHFVLVSSVSVYGQLPPSCCVEDAPCLPEGPYADSKWQAELRAAEIAASSGMELTILRLATLYGPGDPGNVGRLLRSIDQRRFIWIGSGANNKCMLYRDDAARACLAVLQSSSPRAGVYNVSAPPCTMREIVEQLALNLKQRRPGWHIPASWALVLSQVISKVMHEKGSLGNLHSTVTKWLADDTYDARCFYKTFNFATQVDLAEGIRRQVAWYREHTVA
jgi:nucleoside-diphosphate-sugar epimerase